MTIHASLNQAQTVVQTYEDETIARGETINSAAISARSDFDAMLATASQAAFAYDAVRGNGTPEADAAWKHNHSALALLGKAKIACINAYCDCTR